MGENFRAKVVSMRISTICGRAAIAILTILVLIAWSVTPASASGETYHSSVFAPNGVVYSINTRLNMTVMESGTPSYARGNLSGTITLLSQQFNSSLIKWYGVASLSWSLERCEEGQELSPIKNSTTVPIPALFLIKVNTRKVYFVNISIEKIREGQLTQEDLMAIVSKITSSEIYPYAYALNMFYIPINVHKGDVITYGFREEKELNESLWINATITGEQSVAVGGSTYSAWVARIDTTLKNLSDIIETQLGVRPVDLMGIEDPEVARIVEESTLVNVTFFYDKETGWLLQLKLKMATDFEQENVTVSGTLDFEMALQNAGTVNIGNKGFFERMTGMPDPAFWALGIVLVIANFIALTRKRVR